MTAAKIRRWQPYRNPVGTMLGYLSIELPSGLVINDAKLMIGPAGKPWIAMPSQKRVDREGNPVPGPDGKPSYTQHVEFASRPAADRFRDLVLDAIRAAHPEALEVEGGR
jgi:DNA-binding cell septation regulator SpoVG